MQCIGQNEQVVECFTIKSLRTDLAAFDNFYLETSATTSRINNLIWF